MKKLSLTTNIIKFVLVGLGVLASAMLMLAPIKLDDGKEAVAAFRDGGTMGFSMGFTITMFVICLAIVLIFFIVQAISNTKKTLMSIIGILAAVVIYMIFSAMGTADSVESLQLQGMKYPVSSGTINSTTAGIFTVVFALIVGVLAIIFFGFKNSIQRLK